MRLIIIITAIFIIGCKSENKGATLPDTPGKITVTQGDKPPDDVSPLIGYNARGEYQVRFAPDGEENETTKMVGAAAVSRSVPYSDIGRRIAEKSLGKEYKVWCAPCHDNYANGVIGPSLLDKSADDIYGMIIKYRNNEKNNYLMGVFVNKMSDVQIRGLSEKIAEFNKMMREYAK